MASEPRRLPWKSSPSWEHHSLAILLSFVDVGLLGCTASIFKAEMQFFPPKTLVSTCKSTLRYHPEDNIDIFTAVRLPSVACSTFYYPSVSVSVFLSFFRSLFSSLFLNTFPSFLLFLPFRVPIPVSFHTV
jgi:hypothetical protein